LFFIFKVDITLRQSLTTPSTLLPGIDGFMAFTSVERHEARLCSTFNWFVTKDPTQ